MPPARTEAGGELLPPEPAPELDVDVGAVEVPLVPPTPPAPTPVLDAVPDGEEAKADWLEDCKDAGTVVDAAAADDAEADDVLLVGVGDICEEEDPELRV